MKCLCVFYSFFDPGDPGTLQIDDFNTKSIKNRSILFEIGFQKLRIGRSFVVTKYEPMASRVDPVLKVLFVDMRELCWPKSSKHMCFYRFQSWGEGWSKS